MANQVSRFSDSGGADGAVVERDVELDFLDLLLPCRTFSISYKIAELGKVSLTSEFLLRLVHAVEGVREAEAAAFFGFSASEIAFVVNDLTELGYLERSSDTLKLTLAGRDLFRENSEEPQIYEVEQRNERHGFDLIALAPCEFQGLSSVDAVLPELPVAAERVTRASKSIPSAFRRHFDGLVRRASDTPLGQSLYSVDTVTALGRFSSPVPIRVRSKIDLPGVVEPDLTDRWTGYELDDRSEIVESAANVLKLVRVRPENSQAAFHELARIAPDVLNDFVSRGNLRRDALYREATRRAGEFRIDRPTVLLVGTLFTDANVARLKRALDYAAKREEVQPTRAFFWQAPTVPLWGASRRLSQTIDALAAVSEDPAEKAVPIGVLSEKPPPYVERTFDNVLNSRAHVMQCASLEVLLVPGRVAAVIVHGTAGSNESYPVPLGILSFDSLIVQNTAELMRNLILPLAPAKSSLNEDELRDIVYGSLD